MAVNDSEVLLGLSQTFKKVQKEVRGVQRGSKGGPKRLKRLKAFPSKNVLKDKNHKNNSQKRLGAVCQACYAAATSILCRRFQ